MQWRSSDGVRTRQSVKFQYQNRYKTKECTHMHVRTVFTTSMLTWTWLVLLRVVRCSQTTTYSSHEVFSGIYTRKRVRLPIVDGFFSRRVLSTRWYFLFCVEPRRNNGFINMLRTMKGKALALGGESAILAAAEQASPAEAPAEEEEAEESGTMAARIDEK